MYQFFQGETGDTLAQPLPAQSFHYQPPTETTQTFEFMPAEPQPDDDEDFGPPEEDEVTRRIREEEELVTAKLAQKAAEEYELKSKRREEGRLQLQQFRAIKEKEQQERKKDNLQAQEKERVRLVELSKVGGWEKVVSCISTKQGQYPDKQDVVRMRQSILHRRQDEK